MNKKTSEFTYRQKRLDVPLYPGRLLLIDSDDLDKVNELRGRMGHPEDTYVYASTSLGNLNGWMTVAVVLNPRYEHKKLGVGTIAHEACHAADFIFENCGATHDFNNPEPYTYLVGWVADEIAKFLGYGKIQH